MKWIAGVVAVLAAALAIAYFAVSRGPAPAPSSAGRAAGTAVGDETSDRGSSARSDDPAVARLRAELAAAAPVSGVSDEDRLADAMAWVRANRPPDYPYAELEAKMLAIMTTILDGERRSPAWVMNIAIIELDMIRALDADGDGVVSAEEIRAYNDSNIQMLGELEHPYLLARLDTNGDGELSDDERSGVESPELFTEGALAGLSERAMLEAWDANNDGLLTDAERTEGRAGLKSSFGFNPEELMRTMEEQGAFDGEEGQARREQVQAQLAEQQRAMAEVGDSLAVMQLCQPYFEVMSFDASDEQAIEVESFEAAPPPERLSFDRDDDGQLSPEENDEYMDALDSFQHTAMDQSAYMRQQFLQAAKHGDTNRDGRFTPAEWDGYYDALLAERDRKLFLRSYDTDANGAVTSDELMTFIDWHKARSLRADANFDGLVDARDLEHAMNAYQRLNR